MLVKKKAFLLLEVLIVIALIGLVGSLFSFRFYGKRKNFYFEKTFEKISEKVIFVQKMALFGQRDFFLSLQEENGRLFVNSYSPEKKFLPQKGQLFQPIYFRFLSEDGKTLKKVEVFSSPKGFFYPPGIIQLSLKEDFSNAKAIRLD